MHACGQPIIEINSLCVTLGGTNILNHLNLTINRGEIFAIVGGSGSGKTTLLRSILMLLPINSGTIKLFGKDITKLGALERRSIQGRWGVMFQQGALFGSLTVLENVTFPLYEETKLDSKTIKDIAELKLSMVGLPLDAANKYPSELSGGMRKRTAVARAIALDPDILFLDEPTAGLDPKGASGLDQLILHLKQNLGLSIIMVTHDLDTLWRTTDRVAFLADGRISETGSMAQLCQSKNEKVADYFNDPRSKAAQHIGKEL